MKFASAISSYTETSEAIDQVCREIREQLDDDIDLVVFFVSHDHAANSPKLASSLCERLGTHTVIGCTGESICGIDTELEQQSALSVWAASLPDVDVLPMHLKYERAPDGGAIVGWDAQLEDRWPDEATMLLLAEPFSFPADHMLETLNSDRPGMPILGGMASGAESPGDNCIFMADQTFHEGAVAILLSGNVAVHSVVSQGCRPIGSPLVITKSERNVIYELGGKPALIQLKEIFDTLPTSDQALVQQGLHVGRVVSEYQDHREQGDFLVRNVLGLGQDDGSVVIGDYVRTGQTIQFHLRDATTADAELNQLLSGIRDKEDFAPQAALLFTCNGRGTRLFPEPHHDAACITKQLDKIPTAGLFAQGEFGPIGGQNFVHGFTASIALFGQKE